MTFDQTIPNRRMKKSAVYENDHDRVDALMHVIAFCGLCWNLRSRRKVHRHQ